MGHKNIKCCVDGFSKQEVNNRIQIYEDMTQLHIYIHIIYRCIYRLNSDPYNNDQLPVGLITLLLEHCSGIIIVRVQAFLPTT